MFELDFIDDLMTGWSLDPIATILTAPRPSVPSIPRVFSGRYEALYYPPDADDTFEFGNPSHCKR